VRRAFGYVGYQLHRSFTPMCLMDVTWIIWWGIVALVACSAVAAPVRV